MIISYLCNSAKCICDWFTLYSLRLPTKLHLCLNEVVKNSITKQLIFMCLLEKIFYKKFVWFQKVYHYKSKRMMQEKSLTSIDIT